MIHMEGVNTQFGCDRGHASRLVLHEQHQISMTSSMYAWFQSNGFKLLLQSFIKSSRDTPSRLCMSTETKFVTSWPWSKTMTGQQKMKVKTDRHELKVDTSRHRPKVERIWCKPKVESSWSKPKVETSQS